MFTRKSIEEVMGDGQFQNTTKTFSEDGSLLETTVTQPMSFAEQQRYTSYLTQRAEVRQTAREAHPINQILRAIGLPIIPWLIDQPY